jgi:DNA polymerase-1
VGESPLKFKEYGSMENLLANTDKLKGKMKRIMTNKEKILSKTLATILLDCRCFDEKDYELSTPDVEKQMLF